MLLNVKELKIYLISPGIDKYKARVLTVFERLVTSGFNNIEYVKSVPGSNSTDSLSRTNLEIMKKELRNGCSRPFMILEDDVNILFEYDRIEVPDDADAIYFGVSQWVYPYAFNTLGNGYHIRTNSATDITDTSPLLTRIKGMTSAHAILFINQEYIRRFINLMTDRLSYITPHDLIFATMHASYNVYALKNPMFYQDKSLGGQENVTKLCYNGVYYTVR